MDYLTATEFSKKWGITSRMVARYCETGRIVGAHKKGKTWLIPVSAEKPLHQRRKKANGQNNRTRGSRRFTGIQWGG